MNLKDPFAPFRRLRSTLARVAFSPVPSPPTDPERTITRLRAALASERRYGEEQAVRAARAEHAARVATGEVERLSAATAEGFTAAEWRAVSLAWLGWAERYLRAREEAVDVGAVNRAAAARAGIEARDARLRALTAPTRGSLIVAHASAGAALVDARVALERCRPTHVAAVERARAVLADAERRERETGEALRGWERAHGAPSPEDIEEGE